MFAYLKQKSCATPLSPLRASRDNLSLPLHAAESGSLHVGTEHELNSFRLVTTSSRPPYIRESLLESPTELPSSCLDYGTIETESALMSPASYSGKKIVPYEFFVLRFHTCFCCMCLLICL
jgi:hypothetical protein